MQNFLKIMHIYFIILLHYLIFVSIKEILYMQFHDTSHLILPALDMYNLSPFSLFLQWHIFSLPYNHV